MSLVRNIFKQRSLDDEPILLLDVNALSSDGSVSLDNYHVSPDGNLLAYKLSVAGSDWAEIRVLDIETGQQYSDSVKRVKASEISWTNNSKGFFYCVSNFNFS